MKKHRYALYAGKKVYIHKSDQTVLLDRRIWMDVHRIQHGVLWVHWIKKCPSCGNCASDLSKPIKGAAKVVKSATYKQQLRTPKFHKLANLFLCSSLILENAGEYADAGWASIHAAWVCDDAEKDSSAKKCRERAIILLQKAQETGQKFTEKKAEEDLLIVDLLRRSRQFEQANKNCESGLKKKPNKLIRSILLFQGKLISQSDVACYSVAKATGKK